MTADQTVGVSSRPTSITAVVTARGARLLDSSAIATAAATACAIETGTLYPPEARPMPNAVAPAVPTIAICGQVRSARCAAASAVAIARASGTARAAV